MKRLSSKNRSSFAPKASLNSVCVGVTALMLSLAAGSAVAAGAGWEYIASEGGAIDAGNGEYVRFGEYYQNNDLSLGQWTYKYVFSTGGTDGTVGCDTNTFGEPYQGKYKRCEKLNNGWTFLVNEGAVGRLQPSSPFDPNQVTSYEVKYGAFDTDGVEQDVIDNHFTRPVSMYPGTYVSCTNTNPSWNYDPYPYRIKACFFKAKY